MPIKNLSRCVLAFHLHSVASPFHSNPHKAVEPNCHGSFAHNSAVRSLPSHTSLILSCLDYSAPVGKQMLKERTKLCRGSVEVAKRDPIDLEYTTAFGVAGLAPLGSGYALVLITAGERVRP